MAVRDPELNFEDLWQTFEQRYPFFEVRNVDWQKQYEIFRPKVTHETSDGQLFDILCEMLKPLNDGHVELEAKLPGQRKKRRFTAEEQPKFYREFDDDQIKKLFRTTRQTLVDNGFSKPRETEAWILEYGRSDTIGYLRILELEDVSRKKVRVALDRIARDFRSLSGFIIDIRDCPGGDDDTAIMIINRFCDQRRVAFHRKTKVGPGSNEFSNLKTWHIEPEGDTQFTGPVVVLTCDAVFSGGEAFALAIRELPQVTLLGNSTNGIFSYTLEKKLPNGWRYRLSYQVYLSADMVCYEGAGVPVDIALQNTQSDIANGVDPLIVRAMEILQSQRS
ncbi:MAG: S41 family peptidase [Pseudomonadota bacterium]